MKGVSKGKIHIVIGDCQVKEDVPTDHLRWIGRYIREQFRGVPNVRLICLGDFWDMESLSSYDRGKASMENRRYRKDIKVGNDAWSLMNDEIFKGLPMWKWEYVFESLDFHDGNHEDRVTRAAEDNAQLEGTIGLSDMNVRAYGWRRHAFRKVVDLDGVSYSHYFYNPNTGRPYSGESMDARLKTIGRSFTMGHQQGMKFGLRQVGERRHQGLVLGSTYLHDEKYLGPQATAYWRGIVVCHQVENGMYDPMMVSLEYLCRRYENKTLKEFLR